MSGDEDLGPRLSGRLHYLLKRAQNDLAALHEELLAPIGINAGELSVLLLLDAREPESQQQAAQRLGVDRTTMVALIDALEGKGLVARRPSKRLAADVGELDDIAAPVRGVRAARASDQAERRLLSRLDGAETEHLRSLLRRVAAAPGDR